MYCQAQCLAVPGDPHRYTSKFQALWAGPPLALSKRNAAEIACIMPLSFSDVVCWSSCLTIWPADTSCISPPGQQTPPEAPVCSSCLKPADVWIPIDMLACICGCMLPCLIFGCRAYLLVMMFGGTVQKSGLRMTQAATAWDYVRKLTPEVKLREVVTITVVPERF